MLKLSLVVLNFNTKEITLDCLRSVFEFSPKIDFEVIVVDNASTDGSVEAIKSQFKRVRLLVNEKNLGFSAGNNVGLKAAHGELILLLNSDTKVMANSLDNLVEFAAAHPELGIISGKLLNPDKSFQPNAGELPNPLNTLLWLTNLDELLPSLAYQAKAKSYYRDEKVVGWVSGALMLVRKDTLERVGFLDERIFMYAEDVEYCFRANQKGVKVGWTNQAEIIHVGGASLDQPKFRQWLGEFKGLLYIYQKYYGGVLAALIKTCFYIFILLRAILYTLMGKIEFGRTYAKVAINL